MIQTIKTASSIKESLDEIKKEKSDFNDNNTILKCNFLMSKLIAPHRIRIYQVFCDMPCGESGQAVTTV